MKISKKNSESFKQFISFLRLVNEKNEKYKLLMKFKPDLEKDSVEDIQKWKDEFIKLFQDPTK